MVVLIKEYLLPEFFRLEHVLSPDIQQGTQFCSHFRCLCRLIQSAVAFKNMEQGVHGTLCHNTVFGKLFVRFRIPETVIGFSIAACIAAMVFHALKQLIRCKQRLRISGQPIISRQGVDRKRLIVSVLGGVQRFSIKSHRPVHAAGFAVHAVPHQKPVRMICRLPQVRTFQQHCRFGKKPEDPAVKDTALFGFFIPPQVQIHITDKPAIMIVLQRQPERNDFLFQHHLHFCGQFHVHPSYCWHICNYRLPSLQSSSQAASWD